MQQSLAWAFVFLLREMHILQLSAINDVFFIFVLFYHLTKTSLPWFYLINSSPSPPRNFYAYVRYP